ncbi:MAG TPA: polynucleotide adenylyltransferase PcnB [Buchnera sp. (in: enterobacteria)]|nr:polynucleotide adenylyltransferase PcnB [Buchnera sp. (in: enterobacteria)]
MTLIIHKYYKFLKKKKISKNAIKVLIRLKKTGYQSYLVGGSVRDLILGKLPKDFDIATNATPEQLKKIFKNCRIIGRRFRIAHIMFKSEFIEVSTFRKNHNKKSTNKKNKKIKKTINGMLLNDNIFGNIEDDYKRRDITINALYYDINTSIIRDYVGGLEDLKKKKIRLIGDPETRYREDPIRILRVIRFAVKLKMKISKKTEEPITRLAILLKNIPSSRLFYEISKLIQTGEGYKIYKKFKKYKLFNSVFFFPKIKIDLKTKKLIKEISIKAIKLIDDKVKKQKQENDETDFLFSSILWYFLVNTKKKIQKENKTEEKESFLNAIEQIFKNIIPYFKIPKQILSNCKEIWKLQWFLENNFKKSKIIKKITKKQKFQKSYNLLKIRSEIENNTQLYKIKKIWKKHNK